MDDIKTGKSHRASVEFSEQEFLATEFEFEYCEECHGDQQDHRALWIPNSRDAELGHQWGIACSAEQDWQRRKRWTHPCRITGCSDHHGGITASPRQSSPAH